MLEPCEKCDKSCYKPAYNVLNMLKYAINMLKHASNMLETC